MINFSLRLNNSIQFLNTSSIRIGLKFVFLNLSSDFSENLLFLSFKENPDSLAFHFATWLSFLARTKFVFGSPRSCVCEKGLSLQQTFFMRVISLSSVRWFFSLLNEQWWRERFSDNLIVEFRIARVRRLRIHVAGYLLEDHCRSLWVVEVVEELGLITCKWIVYRHGATLLIVRECSDFIPRRWRHWRRCDRQRTGRQSKRKGRSGVETRERQTRRHNKRTLKHVTSWMACGWNECAPETLWATMLVR